MFDRIQDGLWWDRAWRLTKGCTKVSPGCQNCWAEREANMRGKNPKMFHHYGGMNDSAGKWTGEAIFLDQNLSIPSKVKKPQAWAIWNDLYHPDVSDLEIISAYEWMRDCPWHTFIVLTKRPERICDVLYGRWGGQFTSLPNVWHLTTAENQEMADERIPELLKLREYCHEWPVLGVSIEPLLGKILYLPGVNQCHLCGCTHWIIDGVGKYCKDCGEDFIRLDLVICGGESGPDSRAIPDAEPVRSLQALCEHTGVDFYFKQWGNYIPFDQCAAAGIALITIRSQNHSPNPGLPIRVGKKQAGRLLDGREYLNLPFDTR